MTDVCQVPFGALNVGPGQLPEALYDPRPALSPAKLVLAGGCFWCVEAVFAPVEGVLEVRPGYAGGTAETANYKTICSGQTDHAEVIELSYDPDVISMGQLLKLFFGIAHDPTQENRQGHDIGRQYRSAIFYSDEVQQQVAEGYIQQLVDAECFKAPLQTRLEPLDVFYPAEAYHHQYAAENPDQPYIQAVALPKVEKLKAAFPDQLKSR